MDGALKTTHITVYHGYSGGGEFGWWARIDFDDFGLCTDNSVQGTIKTKYGLKTISEAVDLIKEDAKAIGIKFVKIPWVGKKILCYLEDGNSTAYPPPADWKRTLQQEAARIGFYTPYK